MATLVPPISTPGTSLWELPSRMRFFNDGYPYDELRRLDNTKAPD